MICFASQCTPISNNSVLPSRKSFKINKKLYKLNEDDMLKVIRNLNVNKARGHDDISVTILKTCDSVLNIQWFSIQWLWSFSRYLENASYYTNPKLFLFVKKYLKKTFLTIFFYSLKIIIYLLLNNLVLGSMIPV